MNIDAQQIYNMNSAGIKPTMVGGSKDKVLKGIDMTEKIGTYLTLEERARARIVDKNESMKYIITREEMDKELELHIEQLQRAREDMRRSQEMLGSLSEIRREINDVNSHYRYYMTNNEKTQ
jgi:tRNA(Phe) wybutosine-synthesizing methylase Tyw3